MSSAQPGSMPDTNTERVARRARPLDRLESPAPARSPGGAAGRTTSTPRWRPTRGTRAGRRTRRRAGCRRWRCTRPRRRRRASATAVSSVASTPSGSMTGELTGVAPDLLRVRHDDTHELEVGVRRHRSDRRSSRVARPPHHHPVRHGRQATPKALFGNGLPPLAPPVGAHEDAQLRVPAVRDLRGVLQVVEAVLALLLARRGCPSAPRSRRGAAARSTASRRSPSVPDRG